MPFNPMGLAAQTALMRTVVTHSDSNVDRGLKDGNGPAFTIPEIQNVPVIRPGRQVILTA
jgi:hypothetical protein